MFERKEINRTHGEVEPSPLSFPGRAAATAEEAATVLAAAARHHPAQCCLVFR